jgi:hypothetical protein
MVGPMAGANVADSANMASPIGCFGLGKRVIMMVKAIGIRAPPANPWIARNTIICSRSVAKAQATEKTRNRIVVVRR